MALEPLFVKTEAEEVCVKEEAECENKETGAHVKEETGAHVKEETGAHVKEETRAHVKEEVQCEDSTDLCELYTDHQVKDELALGPEELHRPCVPSARVAPNKYDARGQPCSSRLERSTQLGLHTFTLTDMGTIIECSFKRMLVLDTWLSIKDSKSEVERWRRVFEALIQLLPDAENLILDDLEKRVIKLCKRYVAIWKQVSRSLSRLISKYGDWLNEIEVCVLATCEAARSHDNQRPAAVASTSTHRKDFEECSERTNSRRLAELSKVDSSAINSLLDDSSPSDAAAASLTFSTDEVLSLINETKLTKHQYLMVKDFINAKSPDALPSYPKMLEAKKRCYPSQEFITESSAEVELQSVPDGRSSFAQVKKKRIFPDMRPS